MSAIVVSGSAGVGKSTLAREVARRTGAVLLDLDTVTNPLLELLHPGSGAGSAAHWNSPELRAVVRPARYAALRAVAREQVDLGLDVVLVAPFTAELTGGAEWQQLRAAVGPEEPRVLWLRLEPGQRAERLRERGEARDAWAEPGAAQAPVVPHLLLDAALPVEALVELALG